MLSKYWYVSHSCLPASTSSSPNALYWPWKMQPPKWHPSPAKQGTDPTICPSGSGSICLFPISLSRKARNPQNLRFTDQTSFNCMLIHPSCHIRAAGAGGEHQNKGNKQWLIVTKSSSWQMHSPQQCPMCFLLITRSGIRFEGRRDYLWK